MMSMGLGSPMDAIPIFDYLTLDGVWTLIAFLATTAAISFWKIKSSILLNPNSSRFINSSSLPQHQLPSPTEPQTSTDPHPQELSSPSPSPKALCTLENRKSGKFSVYYYQGGQDDLITVTNHEIENQNEHEHEDDEDDNIYNYNDTVYRSDTRANICPREEVELERPMKSNTFVQDGGWEAVLKLKTSEMGWYRYQDLTVLNGNVVQLWNQIVVY